MSSASIKIQYWAESSGSGGLYDLDGIVEFREELAKEYVSVVHGRSGALGGLHQLAVEIVSHLTLQDVNTFLLSGMAYDAMKFGTKPSYYDRSLLHTESFVTAIQSFASISSGSLSFFKTRFSSSTRSPTTASVKVSRAF